VGMRPGKRPSEPCDAIRDAFCFASAANGLSLVRKECGRRTASVGLLTGSGRCDQSTGRSARRLRFTAGLKSEGAEKNGVASATSEQQQQQQRQQQQHEQQQQQQQHSQSQQKTSQSETQSETQSSKPESKSRRRAEEQLLLLASLVGLGTGAGITLFKQGVHAVIEISYGDPIAGTLLPYFREYNVVFIPLLGGVLVGLLRFLLSNSTPGGALRDGVGLSSLLADVDAGVRTGVVTPVSRATAAVVTLGTGCSLGPEGPAVELGVSVSRWIGQLAEVSVARQRLLAAAGAAAGVAAGFNAPIAGVFFAQEVVLPREKSAGGGTQRNTALLLASSLSALVAQAGLGANPAFQLPLYELRNAALELPLYMGLGLLVGVAAIAYTSALRLGSRLFLETPALQSIPRTFHPAIGGLACGIVAVWYPQILFFGYDTLDALLADVQFPLTLLLTLLVLKPALTAISLGSGLVGGTFAPTMFLGATLGASYNKIIEEVYNAVATALFKSSGAASAEWFSTHFAIAGPPAYSIIGMAAALAAVFRAPLTSFLLLFELTRDYRIILPLMATVGLASWLVESVELRGKKREQDSQKAGQRELQKPPSGSPPSGAALMASPVKQKERLEFGGNSVTGEMRSVLARLSVRDALVRVEEGIVCVDKHDEVGYTLERMARAGTRFAFVVQPVELVAQSDAANGEPKSHRLATTELELRGIITLNDVDRYAITMDRQQRARGAAADAGAEDSAGLGLAVPVKDVYSKEVAGVSVDATLLEAYELLSGTEYQQIAVTQEASAKRTDAAVNEDSEGRNARVVRGAIDVERIETAYRLELARSSIRSLMPAPAELKDT